MPAVGLVRGGVSPQASLSTSGNSFGFIEVTKSWVGTTPLLATEFLLPSGVYTETKALIGTNSLVDTCFCEIAKRDGTVLKIFSKIGVPDTETVSTGFTLTTDTIVGFSIYGSNSATVSYIFSIGIK